MFKEDTVLWTYIFYYSIGCTERDETIPDPATPIKKQTVEAHEANKVISSQKVW